MWWLWWLWCGQCVMRACLSMRTHNETNGNGLAQVHWSLRLDCPAGTPLRLFPPKAGSRRPQVQTITQPRVEEKDCEARPPRSPLLRRKRAESFSFPGRWMPRIRNIVRRCTWTCLPGKPDPFTRVTTSIQEMTRSNRLPFTTPISNAGKYQGGKRVEKG